MNHATKISVLLCLVSFLGSAIASAQDVDFVRDIRPIISENCVFCHGPDEDQRQADLRLDTEDGALTVVERSKRDASDLFDRITTEDVDTVMPPPDSNRKLTPKQVELIGRWIDEGAKWEQHWSFRPITKSAVPKVASSGKSPLHNPIDAFVQHRLQSESLTPSPQADRRTLIRRLCLDLTGLPPTPAQVRQFLDDTEDDAYERLVERLLDSPAYGQRMAWDWLDAARYADTNGYQGDRERTMWPWRDWVIDAFNNNMPYDQFTIWQLAGDQLPDATEQQKLATGFCRNHMINGEGGRIAEENRIEYVMDMSETMGTVWLGLTLNCCRCHDHKYDPITNEEYYQFFAFFNQTPVKGNGGDPQTAPVLSVTTADQKKTLANLDDQIKQADISLRELSKQLVGKQAAWEKQRAKELAAATRWETLKPTKTFAIGQRIRVLYDNSILTAGQNPANDTYTILSPTKLSSITGVRIEAMRHSTMTKGGIARSDSGNFVLTGVEVTLVDPDDDKKRVPIKIKSGSASFEQGSLKIAGVFDDDPKSGWAVYNGKPIDRDHSAVLRFGRSVEIPKGMMVEIVLRHDSQHRQHNLGRFRLSLTATKDPKLSGEQDDLVSALQTAAKDRTGDQTKAIAKAHRLSDPDYQATQSKRDALVKKRDGIKKQTPKVMVMQDMPGGRDTFVLERGLYNKPKDKVVRAFPGFLPKPPAHSVPVQQESQPNRLALARWLVDEENPLTSRVTVNRFWQQFFGVGLVKTTEDFGRQGEIPIQMDLLNWLAADFRDSGWDVKELIRKIVTSHTYRQSSKISAAAYELDPKNRLLARGSRFRMPSWMIRDQALAASGLLSTVRSGPSVNTYQPPGIWEEASFGKKTYAQDRGEKLYRRSLFTFWRRIIAPTMFFDTASRQSCTVKMSRTNTPLHALQTLNNTAYVEAARVLAASALKSDASDDPSRINFVLQRVLARDAADSERDVLLRGLNRTRAQFADQKEEAAKLLGVGDSPRDETLDTIEHACWTSLCLAVLNLDETLNRE